MSGTRVALSVSGTQKARTQTADTRGRGSCAKNPTSWPRKSRSWSVSPFPTTNEGHLASAFDLEVAHFERIEPAARKSTHAPRKRRLTKLDTATNPAGNTAVRGQSLPGEALPNCAPRNHSVFRPVLGPHNSAGGLVLLEHQQARSRRAKRPCVPRGCFDRARVPNGRDGNFSSRNPNPNRIETPTWPSEQFESWMRQSSAP